MLGGLQAGITMRLQKAQEIVALNEIQLARLSGLGSSLMG
jgi:hypothetical protein